jgi:hypothetical protein
MSDTITTVHEFEDGIPAFLRRKKEETPEDTGPPITGEYLRNQISVSARKQQETARTAPVVTKQPDPLPKVPAKEETKVEASTQPTAPQNVPVKNAKSAETTASGWRKVARENTKHASRKQCGASRFPAIAALMQDKWVARETICEKLGLVDNTIRGYLGIMSHTAEYGHMISRKVNNTTEYMLPVVA